MADTKIQTPKRQDKRAANALRPVKLTPDYTLMAEGSVLIEVGQTRVLCNATVEQGVPGWRRGQGKGWVTAEYGMLPRATLTRTQRDAERGKVNGRAQEIQRLIGRSLRSVVDLALLGERTVTLDCDVLQADGGTRCAAITGASAALALALGRLTKNGMFKQNPMFFEGKQQHVAAVSVGILDGAVLLDLCYEEDARAEVDANVVMTADGNLVEVQATAERAAFSREQMGEMLDLAGVGIHELFERIVALSSEEAAPPPILDKYGNNFALTCPACRKVFIFSEFLNKSDGRICPHCNKSKALLIGGEIAWERISFSA